MISIINVCVCAWCFHFVTLSARVCATTCVRARVQCTIAQLLLLFACVPLIVLCFPALSFMAGTPMLARWGIAWTIAIVMVCGCSRIRLLLIRLSLCLRSRTAVRAVAIFPYGGEIAVWQCDVLVSWGVR